MISKVNDSIKVLHWSENITLKNIEQFREIVTQFIAQKEEYLILDLAEMNYINSAGLGVIADSVMHARRNNKELVIAEVNQSVKEIFAIVKFTSLMKIFDTKKQAIDYFMVNPDDKEQD